ncbi:hypothetical protein [Sphingobium sp. B8D3D]|uniref:hypothetical protein n=1 Tax=Sphingobium sp. B8D3D TaxID=2940587 RepID=UPI002225350A|nr:hypothetical protein [Sphingobium sp. B8D3D]MCW2415960.1 hypothetical protein [Sphingobium sp. B8D3A]
MSNITMVTIWDQEPFRRHRRRGGSDQTDSDALAKHFKTALLHLPTFKTNFWFCRYKLTNTHGGKKAFIALQKEIIIGFRRRGREMMNVCGGGISDATQD